MHTYQGKEKASSSASAEIPQSEKKVRVASDVTRIPAWAEKAPVVSAGLITHAELVANLERERNELTGRDRARGPVRFRLPLTSDLKSLFVSGNVPEPVLKNRIEIALTRMAKEGRLKTADPVPGIMKKVFPAAGVFDEKEYEKAVDVSDRSKIYKSVAEAETKVTSADKPKLRTTMTDAGKLIDRCIVDAANLKLVFGSKDSVAKAIYSKAKAALTKAITDIDTAVTTDYNLDDPEVGLGGWARFDIQKIHFEPAVAKVVDVDEAKITIIHEACHLADGSVEDKGYYGSAGFEGMSEDDKVTNAAHFEEIPRRKLGKR